MAKCAGYGFRFGGGTDPDSISFVSNDHIFESEDARDNYFTANRDELVNSTPIIVNNGTEIIFQVWGGLTNPDSYDNTQWSTMSIPDRFTELTDTPSGLTRDRLLRVNNAGNSIIHSEARFIDDELFVPGRLITESGTLALGELVGLSESGGFLSLVNNIDSRRYNALDYYVPTDAASSKPRRLALSGAESRVVLSSGADEDITSRDITSTYTATGTGRINALIVNTSQSYRNLRIRIRNISPGNEQDIKFIPSRQDWLDSTGLRNTGTGEQVIRIDDSPLVYDNGRQYSITFRFTGRNSSLAGNSGVPFLAVMAQTGNFVELADSLDLGDYRIDNTVSITSDTTITDSNLNQFNKKLWIVNSSTDITVTLSDDLAITYFGFVVTGTGELSLSNVSNQSVRIDGGVRQEYESGAGAIYVQPSANSYTRLTQRGETGSPGRTGRPGDDGLRGPMGDPATTNWVHAALPAGQIPQTIRVWYSYRTAANATRALPDTDGLSSGWHAFFANDTTTSTLTLTGRFSGTVSQVSLLAQQGCIISYDGTNFREGPARQNISISNFADWEDNPLTPSNSYTTRDGTAWSSGSAGINLDNEAPRDDMLNRLVRVISTTSVYNFDLPTLEGTNLEDIPLGSGYSVVNQGTQVVNIRPRGNDTITRASLTHSFANIMILATGASVTVVRNGNDSWNVSSMSGTITGGI